MGGEVFLPDNLLISLHMVELQTGSFIPETNWIQDRFLASNLFFSIWRMGSLDPHNIFWSELSEKYAGWNSKLSECDLIFWNIHLETEYEAI